jgi:hypothetical protein
MKEYKLVSKGGEKISKYSTYSLELAIEYFAKVKKLKVSQLLKIYNVEEC